MAQSYKDLIVWQKSMELARLVYVYSQSLPKEEVYGLTSQIRRACVSIPSNIAEGYGRRNRGEYLQFLGTANGSAAEVETQLMLIKDLYPGIEIKRAQDLLTEVQKMLNVLMAKLSPKTKP